MMRAVVFFALVALCVADPPGYVVDQDFSYTVNAGSPACIPFTPPEPPSLPPTCTKWHFSKDHNKDGTEGGTVGVNSHYEIFGTAVYHTEYDTTFFINSNHPLSGFAAGGAQVDGTIDPGDLFINFETPNGQFKDAFGKAGSFAIHFCPDSDANTWSPGVYKNVIGHSVTDINQGYASINAYLSATTSQGHGYGEEQTGGSAVPIGYWGDATKPMITSIYNGTRVGGFKYIVFNQDKETVNVARYQVNNPHFLHHLSQYGNPPVFDGTNICDSNAHPDVLCADNDPIADEYITKAAATGFMTGNYNYGFRVKNEVFGSYFTNKAKFRASFAIECSNDFTALDYKFEC